MNQPGPGHFFCPEDFTVGSQNTLGGGVLFGMCMAMSRTKASDPQKVSKPSHWGEAQGMAKLSSDVCVDADSVCRKADKIKN